MLEKQTIHKLLSRQPKVSITSETTELLTDCKNREQTGNICETEILSAFYSPKTYKEAWNYEKG